MSNSNNNNNKRFHFVDNAGQSRFADLTAADRAEIVINDNNNDNATRTIFIRHQPSTSRNVVTIYKRVQVSQQQPDNVSIAISKKKILAKEGPSSFPYACSVCPNRFRNAFALLKHLNKNHRQNTIITNNNNSSHKQKSNNNNAELRQLRSLPAPSGRILFTLLKTTTENKQQKKDGETTIEQEKRQHCYRCRLCPSEQNVKFEFRSQLYLHYKYHRRFTMAQQDRKFVCLVCQRIFVNRSSLFVHIRCRHHPVGLGLEKSFPTQCSLCFKRFRNETELSCHSAQAHFEKRSFSCQKCSRNFRTAAELSFHHQSSHDDDKTTTKKYQCTVCNRYLSTKSNLARHLVLIHRRTTEEQEVEVETVEFDDDPLNMIKCQICCRFFETLGSLIEHRRLRHSDGIDQPWPYLCQTCGQRFQFPSQLAHHLKTAKNHGATKNQVLLPQKRVQFPLSTNQGPAVEMTTVDLSANTEAEIAAAAARERQRQQTVGVAAENNDDEPPVIIITRPPSSNLLGAAAGNDEDWMIPLLSVGRLLEESSSRMDGEVAVARGDISGASALDLDLPPDLMSSEDQANDDVPPPTAQTATASVVVQRGDNAYSCSCCSKVFSRLADANRHVRVVHAERRPFVCDVCEKTFKWRHSYVDHCRTHTGERPYVCEHCQASFTASGNLVRHKKHSHPPQQPETTAARTNADDNNNADHP